VSVGSKNYTPGFMSVAFVGIRGFGIRFEGLGLV